MSARLFRPRHALLAYLLAGGLACGDDAAPSPASTGARDASDEAGLDAEAEPPVPDAAPFDARIIPPGNEGGRDGMIEPPLDDDADVAFCEEDCSALETECRTAHCDLSTLECVIEAKADGLPCGSQELSTCTARDACVDGICQPNHQKAGTPCGDQGHACRLDDECDGQGHCVDNGLRPVGAPCGDSTSSECDAADTCNAQGECDDNHAELDAPCGDQGVMCRYDDVCDGNGTCIDLGFVESDSCPNPG